MSKVKKLLAIVLALAMVMGFNITVFATNDDGIPDANDTATVTITNIKAGATVTLYQVAEVKYGTGGQGFLDYIWAPKIADITETEPTTDQINTIAKGIKTGDITAFNTITNGTLNEGRYTATVEGGAYIALITQATDGTVYNPILLTATYGESGNLSGGSIDSTSNYLYGSTAVAKSTTPTIDKEITDGTTTDSSTDEERDTASVGDVITFTITPTIPDYPSNAKNKTFFISDTMSNGLTFDYSSLTVSITGQTVTKEGNNFMLNGKVIATAVPTPSADGATGFNLNFNYDNLISDKGTGAVYQPIVIYEAVINEEAVAGGTGNTNDAELYYANDPNSGETWKDTTTKPDPETAKGIDYDEDSETVYTYQLGFRKTDIDKDEEGNDIYLGGAVFGIYKDEACTQLVDKVTTNSDGYAVSTNVAAGDYWVKELVAPAGYTLNTTLYKITANWTTAITTINGTVTDRTYTTQRPSDGAVQVGWIKDNVFYALDEMSEDEAEKNEFSPAYLDTETTTTTTTTTTGSNPNGGGIAFLSNSIPNTKISSLPSTGGIGTTIFTIGGCVIMIAAAGLYFASRRRQENK